MEKHFETTITDDDGVAVVASEMALKKRYADQAFDYAFPEALLQGMRLRELFAWRTGGEGTYRVAVDVVSEAVFARSECDSSTPEAMVILDKADALLVLPYSQFTYGCDNGAEFDLTGGVGARTELPASCYRIRVVRVGADGNDWFGGSFRVLLCAAEAATASAEIDEVPGWQE